MTRILVVEKQPAIRCGLRMRLKLESDMAVIGEAGDGPACLALAEQLRPDVILMEIEPVGMNSFGLIRAIRGVSPNSAIVILTLRDDAVTRRQARDAGAAAFVSKQEDGDRLLEAIRKVAGGQQASSRSHVRLDV